MELLKSYAIDAPTNSDYEFGSVFQEEGALPRKVMLFNTPFQDQGATPACSCFCSAHLGTELDRNDTEKFYDGFELWKEALKRGASNEWGWSNKAALDMLRELKIISGYTVAGSLNEVLLAISKGMGIFGGTNKCSWSKTSQTGVFSYTENGAGHFFAILGYDMDEEILWAKNSWSDSWGPFGGKFKIPFSQLTNLYTRFVVSDNKTLDIINYKKKMDEASLKKAVDTGIFNGQDLDRQVPRRELGIMLGRLIEKLEANGIKLTK